MSVTNGQGALYSAPREWTRVHPVSPYLGSGPILGFIALYWLARVLPSWVVGKSEELEVVSKFPVLMVVAAVVVIVGAVIGFGVLSWRRNEYRIGDDTMHHRKGILFKQLRQSRLDRIEAVDVVQPLLARIFGLAQLSVQVAGGKGSGIDLKFLRLGDAEALRNEILSLAAGAKVPHAVPGLATPGDAGVAPAKLRDLATNIGAGQLGLPAPATAVPAAPERDVFVVPTGRLVGSVVLSTQMATVAAVGIALVVAAVVFGSVVGEAILAFVGTSLFAFVTLIAAVGGFFWTRINGGFKFTAATSADGLRLRHGLLETRRQTVVPGRVQALHVSQPWLWRAFGWYRLTMNVAGYQDDQEKVSTLLPVGKLDDVLMALWLVLPDLTDRDPEGAMARAVTGSGSEDGFTPSPKRARLVDPWQWKQRGVRAGDGALMIRSGRFTRVFVVVPHQRTQSLGVTQGPLQRARRLASITVHSTPGPVTPVAAHLDVTQALELLDQQAARARAGRGAGRG